MGVYAVQFGTFDAGGMNRAFIEFCRFVNPADDRIGVAFRFHRQQGVYQQYPADAFSAMIMMHSGGAEEGFGGGVERAEAYDTAVQECHIAVGWSAVQ